MGSSVIISISGEIIAWLKAVFSLDTALLDTRRKWDILARDLEIP